MGYTFAFGPQHYECFKDGTPFTLVDCLRETEGVGFARIYSPTGRLVLRDAGSRLARRIHILNASRDRHQRKLAQWRVAVLLAGHVSSGSYWDGVQARISRDMVAA